MLETTTTRIGTVNYKLNWTYRSQKLISRYLAALDISISRIEVNHM